LLVGLDPERDIPEDDWSATVVRSLPYSKFGNVTIIIRRRYLKEEARYDDTDLLVAPAMFETEDLCRGGTG
jgi:Rad3-related DNA helicase